MIQLIHWNLKSIGGLKLSGILQSTTIIIHSTRYTLSLQLTSLLCVVEILNFNVAICFDIIGCILAFSLFFFFLSQGLTHFFEIFLEFVVATGWSSEFGRHLGDEWFLR